MAVVETQPLPTPMTLLSYSIQLQVLYHSMDGVCNMQVVAEPHGQ